MTRIRASCELVYARITPALEGTAGGLISTSSLRTSPLINRLQSINDDGPLNGDADDDDDGVVVVVVVVAAAADKSEEEDDDDESSVSFHDKLAAIANDALTAGLDNIGRSESANEWYMIV